MKNIEIKTAQNVVLEYELATLRDRIVAFLIDMVILFLGMLLLSLIFAAIITANPRVVTIFYLGAIIFYSLAMEILNHGQSVGKKMMRIQVIKTTGGEATYSDYVARWVFRLIDIWLSLGGIASILIASSSRAQRIGDIVASTAVIKIQSNTSMKLDDLLEIHAQNAYTPHYPQARHLHEEDVLLIKTTLDRSAEYRNPAHQEAVDLLEEKIKFALSVENNEGNKRKFLQTILKDYVVLTR